MRSTNPELNQISKETNPRVCMVVNQVYNTDTRVISYANTLANVGIAVDVIGTKDTTSSPANKNPRITVYPIPINRLYKSGFSYIVKSALSLFFFTVYLFILYLKYHYEIIHIHNMPDFLVLTATLPKLLGAKIILDIHDPMPEFYMSKFEKDRGSFAVRLLIFQERFSSRMANTIITANPTFKKLLVRRGLPSDKITIINNIPDPEIFIRPKEANNRHAPFLLIYPGTIAPRYGLDLPIRALPRLVENIPNIQIKIIGKRTDYGDELKRLAKKLQVGGHIQILPHLPAIQIPREIAMADIGIYTALPDPHMSIAVPGKVLEYAVMGIPIVASRLRVLEELFDESSVLFFEPGNVSEFEGCVLKLYQDLSLKKRLVQQADILFVKKYTWVDELDKYVQLIHLLTA